MDKAKTNGLTAAARSHLYLTACGTGLRTSELASLTPRSFELDATPTMVVLRPWAAKSREAARQPFPAGAAEALRAYLAGKPAGEPVWPGTWSGRSADMLKLDLESAGIPYAAQGDDGPVYADLHSLRHTYITMLERGDQPAGRSKAGPAFGHPTHPPGLHQQVVGRVGRRLGHTAAPDRGRPDDRRTREFGAGLPSRIHSAYTNG